MRDGKILSLLRFQITGLMRVSCKKHLSFKLPDLLFHLRDNGNGFPGSQCSINKVILHVYYNKDVFHFLPPSFSYTLIIP